ncbi:50S ribosomal protein L3 [bacterium]|jgi:large subunit ribosomal protein L3|nr:50S ribosomal protein L3 [bacterium]MBT3903519.1 50S ribosomal protein L3 [bacterium]MBT5346115.1 50S ribosomal protein L3 [bacterium]MBT6131384.1 50S ribosomal protein L3 [bacterium]MBT6529156.1 50S ribosomal protein L3 [bacterium]
MVNGLWGKKVGMTQIFVQEDGRALPVTVIEVTGWFVTQIKDEIVDGYHAVQVARMRKRYLGKDFDPAWLKNKKRFFGLVREIRLDQPAQDVTVGQALRLNDELFGSGSLVDVTGISKGCGFAGVVRRYDFAGGPASHGHRLGRNPGAMCGARTQGKVPKGKKLPGHMGNVQVVTRNLKVVRIELEHNIMLVKGSVPGKSGSFVFVKKSG